MTFIARIIFKIAGWTLVRTEGVNPERCVVIAAPHTTNWDLVYMVAAFKLLAIPLKFAIKKEWINSPLGWLFKYLGAIGIDRTPKEGQKKKSMVEAMADMFEGRDHIALAIAPEGTRSLRTEWKTGFYHVAKIAKVPIGCGYLDYAKKQAGIGMIMDITDDEHADLKKIMKFYQPISGKFPENFSLDIRYTGDKPSSI